MSSQATTIKLDDDEQATPINQLQQSPPQNNNVVNDIMNSYQDMEADDMEDNPEEVYQRQMMNDINEPHQEQEYDEEYDEQEQGQQYQHAPVKKTNQTMLSKLLDTIKPALVVVVLFFALNQTVIINMLCSLIQTTMGEESNYNMYGLILRSIIAGALFYATSYFI